MTAFFERWFLRPRSGQAPTAALFRALRRRVLRIKWRNMQESYIQDLFAERIGGKRYGKDTAIYKFEKIKRAKRAAMEANPDGELFDLGVGEPDAMADAGIVETLY